MTPSDTPERSQVRLALIAVHFYTRIPVPTWVGYSQTALEHCNRYFPLIGYLVAALSGGVFLVLAHLLPQGVAAAIAVGCGIWMTGAFHEDGLADLCDGFGGGYGNEQILTIMKDSRLGTYGAVGLMLCLGTKVLTLASLPIMTVIPGMWIAHSLSRLFALSFVWGLPYARPEGKSKPVATGIRGVDLFIAALFALAPLFAVPLATHGVEDPSALGMEIAHLSGAIFIVLLPLSLYLRRLLHRTIGGYTGDCLGAAQQLSELGILIALLALWSP